MYSKNYTTYSHLSVKDISQIPLPSLTFEYEQIVTKFRNKIHDAKQDFIRVQQENYVRQYNAVNEKPYEGSFEECHFEALANKKFSDFSGLGSEVTELVETFITKYSLKKHSSWFLPQMLAQIADNLEPEYQEGEETLSVRQLVTDIKKDPALTAMWLLCKHPTRSSLLDKQTHPNNVNYCSLVPLILAAFKKYKNIPYSKWTRSDIHGIVEPQLAEAMTMPYSGPVEKEYLLGLREYSLTPKSGKDAGKPKNPATTYSVYPPPDSFLSGKPMLYRIMMLQTWCAHPLNRTSYMVLDPADWDNMPEPIISSDGILSSEDVEASYNKHAQWML